MHSLRQLLCLYLSVAVFLAAAVCIGNDRRNVTDVIIESAPSEEVVDSEVFLSQESPEESEISSGDENTSEEYAGITEPVTENTTESEATETERATENTVAAETEAESTTAEDAESVGGEEEITSDALMEEDEIVSFAQLLEVDMQYHEAYAPSATAEKVSPLYFLSETTDSLATEESVNVYTFSLERRAVFSYAVAHDVPAANEGWVFALYEEYDINGDGSKTGYRLIDTLKTTVSTSDSSPETGLSKGNYRLVVTKGSEFSAAQYTINAKLTETSDYEIECNDNIYRYTEIYSGVPVKGSASYHDDRQDDDYYLFRMYEDGFVDLKFEHATVKDKVSVCWQVLLFSEDGSCMFSVNSLFTDTVNKSGKIGLKAGNYYVLIRNRVYTDITYTLTMSRTDNSDYENEKNDTPETADSISAGVTVTGNTASQINGIDRDYFRFELSEPGFCTVDFSHEPSEENSERNGWNIVLLDEGGKVLSRSISAWGDDVIVSPAIGLAKGVYYIRIDSENLYLNSDRYYLTLNFTAAADWETELNDSFETADMLFEGTAVTGLIADRGADYDFDYYVIDVTEGTDIRLEFSHEKLSYSKEIFNFTLYDAGKKAVNSSGGVSTIKVKSDEACVSAVYKSLAPGRYYIKVSAGIFFDSIVYSVEYGKGE